MTMQLKTTPDVLTEMTRRIVDGFGPLRIILFGLRARGDAQWDSDFDFLVVMPDGTDRRQTAIAIRRALADTMAPKDVVVTRQRASCLQISMSVRSGDAQRFCSGTVATS